MPHLRSVSLRERQDHAGAAFPFSVPVIRELQPVDINPAVTFLVGENGSGKSTLLEGLALAARLPTVGSENADLDVTLTAQRKLAKALKLTWSGRRPPNGFFLRAEDFFGFTKALSKLRAELTEEMARIDVEYEGRPAYSKGLALGPLATSIQALERRYGINLDANSHGQSFLKLFRSRFVPDGLYLLDEPEAPLSPQSQLAFIALMGDMLQERAQFVIATHSPILLGFPGATIYSCDTAPMQRVEYEELDHVVITRDFLNGRERFLKYL